MLLDAYIWNLENSTDEPICKAEIETDVENKCMDTKAGKRGWDEMGVLY